MNLLRNALQCQRFGIMRLYKSKNLFQPAVSVGQQRFLCLLQRRLLQQRTRPSGRLVCSVLLALGGVFLIATPGRPQDMQLSASGLLWGLGAALGAVSYSMQSGSLIRRWGSLPVTGFGMLLGSLLLFPLFGLPFPAGLPASAWLWILLIILVGTVSSSTE